MNLRTDVASPRYPETYLNALGNTIDYAETESQADWLLEHMINAGRVPSSLDFGKSYQTATSDVGRIVFQKLQDLRWSSTTMPFVLHVVPQDYGILGAQRDGLPALKSLGVLTGVCKKPRHLKFMADLFDL
jgi:hypothetical protein